MATNELEASLQLMWKRIYAKSAEIAREEVLRQFGANLRGGKLSPNAIQPSGTPGQVLTTTSTGATWSAPATSGTVTSIGLTTPAFLTVTGSPVTGSGTIAVALATQTANTLFAGPTTGAAATPTFRSLVAADLPVATSSAFGAVKPDNTSITISGGVLSATASLPWINVKSYGAVGDGTTDDTTAFTNAIAAIPSTGAVLYCPAGIYKTSGGFTISNPCIVRGDGMADADGTTSGNTSIECTSSTASLFTVTANAATFLDCSLSCTTTPTAGAGITVAGSTAKQKVNYERIGVTGFYINVDVQVGAFWHMHGCMLVGPVLYGIKIRNTVTPDAGDWAISDTAFLCANYNATAAIRQESSGGGKITNCKVVGSWTGGHKYGRAIDRASSVTSTILLVNNCSFEGLTDTGISLTSSGGEWKNIQLNNIEIAMDGSSVFGIVITAGTSGQLDYVTIDNIILFATTGTANAGIVLTNVNHARIAGIINRGFGSVLSQTGCSDIVYDDGTATGTVSSVGITVPAEFSVSGSPVTSSGTLAVSKATQSANQVWAGPTSGSAAAPTFRALVASDLPANVGVGELLVQDGTSAPPVALYTDDGTDFLYQG